MGFVVSFMQCGAPCAELTTPHSNHGGWLTCYVYKCRAGAVWGLEGHARLILCEGTYNGLQHPFKLVNACVYAPWASQAWLRVSCVMILAQWFIWRRRITRDYVLGIPLLLAFPRSNRKYLLPSNESTLPRSWCKNACHIAAGCVGSVVGDRLFFIYTHKWRSVDIGEKGCHGEGMLEARTGKANWSSKRSNKTKGRSLKVKKDGCEVACSCELCARGTTLHERYHKAHNTSCLRSFTLKHARGCLKSSLNES